MTVLLREELNESDLAWAAADLMAANVMAEALRVQAMLAPDASTGSTPPGVPCPRRVPALVTAAGFP